MTSQREAMQTLTRDNGLYRVSGMLRWHGSFSVPVRSDTCDVVRYRAAAHFTVDYGGTAMGRSGVTYEQVADAAARLIDQGRTPTLDHVRAKRDMAREAVRRSHALIPPATDRR